MRPRRVVVRIIVAAALVGIPFGLYAQQPDVRRIALLSHSAIGAAQTEGHEAFRQRLRELGWIEGRNFLITERHVENVEQQRQLSAALERENIAAVVACSHCAFLVRPSGPAPIRGIPIVFIAVSDPVGAKMVAALNRPGGNMTGVSYSGVDLNAKRLQLLKDALPQATRVGVLVTKDHPLRNRMVAEILAAAAALRIEIELHEIVSRDSSIERQREEIDRAFETMATHRVQAVLGLQGPHFYREMTRIAQLSMKYRLPGSFEWVEYANVGAFMAYGVGALEMYRGAANYVDKILRGTKAADLPVEQPTKFQLVINMKTAKALSITIPPSLLLRADRLIE